VRVARPTVVASGLLIIGSSLWSKAARKQYSASKYST
jgi:hypothetical protein